MSADLLRRAAEAMRGEVDYEPHECAHCAYELAVADWLESVADIHDLPLEIATASNDGVDALHIAAIIRNAIAAARAYLGESTP